MLLVPLVVGLFVAWRAPFNDDVGVSDVTPDSVEFVDGAREGRATISNVGLGELWVLDYALTDPGLDDSLTESGPEVETGGSRSTDAGDSSERVNGFEIDWAQSTCEKPPLIIEPGDECEMLFVSDGTFGIAVLHLDLISRTTDAAGDAAIVLIARPSDPTNG